MQAALVVNAASRTGGSDFEVARRELSARGVTLTAAHAVQAPSQLFGLVHRAVEDGAELVVLGGGDGTIGSVAGFLAERGVVLGVLPTGTANDFARTLGLPSDVPGACAVVAHGQQARVDVGVIGDDVFLNLASVGLAVEVTRTLSPTLKRRIGPLAYPVAAVRAYLRHRPFTARLSFPGGDAETVELGDLLQVGIANGRYYGGGAAASPEAGIADSLLDVYAVPRGTLRQRLRVARHFVSGAFTREDHVLHVRTAAVRLETRPPLRVTADGELGPATPVEFSIRPRTLSVMVPSRENLSPS